MAPQGTRSPSTCKSTGVPDKAEMAAIASRGEAFRKAAAGATLLVYPARAGGGVQPE